MIAASGAFFLHEGHIRSGVWGRTKRGGPVRWKESKCQNAFGGVSWNPCAGDRNCDSNDYSLSPRLPGKVNCKVLTIGRYQAWEVNSVGF